MCTVGGFIIIVQATDCSWSPLSVRSAAATSMHSFQMAYTNACVISRCYIITINRHSDSDKLDNIMPMCPSNLRIVEPFCRTMLSCTEITSVIIPNVRWLAPCMTCQIDRKYILLCSTLYVYKYNDIWVWCMIFLGLTCQKVNENHSRTQKIGRHQSIIHAPATHLLRTLIYHRRIVWSKKNIRTIRPQSSEKKILLMKFWFPKWMS